MMNMLQGLMQQATGKQINLEPKTEQDYLAHQEPIAAAMRSMMKILEYEKALLPAEFFTAMVDSLQKNINEALDKLKIPNIPANSDIVSINGEPVTIKSQG